MGLNMERTDQKYWDMEIEPLLNSPQMRDMQWKGLQHALRFFYDKVPFERRRMDKAGVKPEDIRSFDDFARAIPYIGQADYREAMGEAKLDLPKVYKDLFGEERFKDLFYVFLLNAFTIIAKLYNNLIP